jgi:hypothetical protein
MSKADQTLRDIDSPSTNDIAVSTAAQETVAALVAHAKFPEPSHYDGQLLNKPQNDFTRDYDDGKENNRTRLPNLVSLRSWHNAKLILLSKVLTSAGLECKLRPATGGEDGFPGLLEVRWDRSTIEQLSNLTANVDTLAGMICAAMHATDFTTSYQQIHNTAPSPEARKHYLAALTAELKANLSVADPDKATGLRKLGSGFASATKTDKQHPTHRSSIK